MGLADLPLPRVLGRYLLYEAIASGGMASVHLGRLLGPVGFARTVAIKRMHPQFAGDPEFVSMFFDEARLAARIRHPNVVPTLDVVATAGELFLVMDFVQGDSLARLIRASASHEDPIAPAMAATIMAGVLHGLHAAHETTNERGEALDVVHRDVSPQNVLVGVDGVSRVLDFGIAKAAGRLQTTREGQLKGKLPYMAPEQLRGVVTRVSDVYAASVVLWELLTSRRLFWGENEAHIFGQVLEGSDVPPSRFASDVPPALDAVVMRGLAVDPERRYPTAREMACALEDAVPLAPASRIGAWVERCVKESLDKRSARIATIESDSWSYAPAPESSAPADEGMRRVSAPPPLPRLPASVHADGPPVEADDTIETQLSTGTISTTEMKAPRRPISRATPILALSGVVLLGGALLLLRGSGGRGDAQPLGSASIALAAAPPSPSPPLPDPPPSASTSAATPVPSAVEPVAPPRPPKPPVVTPPRPAPPAAAPRPPAAAQKSKCDPPYFIDSAGHKQYKRECF